MIKACREMSVAAYERAGTSGLCAEGRWEMALDSLRSINLSKSYFQIRGRRFYRRKICSGVQ